MNVDVYAKAMRGVLESGVSFQDAVKGLDHVLVKKRHMKLKPKILLVLETLLKQRHKDVLLQVASEKDVSLYKKEIATVAKELNVEVPKDVQINDSLIRGFTIQTTTKRYDASVKRTLLQLYRNVTSR